MLASVEVGGCTRNPPRFQSRKSACPVPLSAVEGKRPKSASISGRGRDQDRDPMPFSVEVGKRYFRGCSFRPKWEQNHSRESIQSRFRSRVEAESRRCGNNVHPTTSAFRRLSPAIPAANHQPANSNAFVRHWVAESAPPPTETREILRACGCGGQFVDVQLSGGFHQRVHAAAHRGGGQLRQIFQR